MRPLTKSLAGINGVLGTWVMVAPFIFEAGSVSLWNNVIVGAIIVLLAGYTYSGAQGHHSMSVGATGLTLLLGIWLIVAPFVSGMSGPLLWNDIVIGVLVAGFASYNTYVARHGERLRVTSDQPME